MYFSVYSKKEYKKIKEITETTERLSSGKRVNKASDESWINYYSRLCSSFINWSWRRFLIGPEGKTTCSDS